MRMRTHKASGRRKHTCFWDLPTPGRHNLFQVSSLSSSEFKVEDREPRNRLATTPSLFNFKLFKP
jgi:hypothetical protein